MYGEEGLQNNNEGHDAHDIFSNFFGRRQRHGHEPSRGADTTMPLRVSLEDLYNGKTLYFSIRRQTICPKCRGHGAKQEEDVVQCPACHGQGVKVWV